MKKDMVLLLIFFAVVAGGFFSITLTLTRGFFNSISSVEATYFSEEDITK